MYYHILEHGDYGQIAWQGVHKKFEDAVSEAERLSETFPDIFFDVWQSDSDAEPQIVNT